MTIVCQGSGHPEVYTAYNNNNINDNNSNNFFNFLIIIIFIKKDQLLTQAYALLKNVYIFSKYKILVIKFLWYKDKHVQREVLNI